MSDRFEHTLEHTLKTKLAEPDNGPDDAVAPGRRIEPITGAGRRRRWSDDDKARIIVESLARLVRSEVARRNGMSPRTAAQPVEADARSRSSRSPADEPSEREPAFDIRVRRAEGQLAFVRGFADTQYAANSWDRERRVVARIDASTSQEDDMLRKGLDIRYVVTSIKGGDGKQTYEIDLLRARARRELDQAA